jgi:RNA polymerase sigma-70 factor (ECF subfamily)
MPEEDGISASAHQDHLGPRPPETAWDGSWLLGRIARKDDEALEQLYRMWADRLYSMALHWLRDEGTAAEALQDCFLRIWKKAGDYDPSKGRGFTWAGMILRGICLDSMRRRKCRPKVWEDGGRGIALEMPSGTAGAEDLFFRDTVRQVREALDQLGGQENESIRAALFDPGTVEDHAARWGVPVATAKTRIFRAMEKLRSMLGHLKGGME